jgi:hypothetical protein
MLDRLEDLLELEVPREDLIEQSTTWEDNIDQLAADDEDMLAYIEQLEKQRDTVESPEASGDAIAREFERYLSRGREWPGGLTQGETGA